MGRWKLHALLLVGVLAAMLSLIAWTATLFILAFAFFFLPMAVMYALSSTALVFAIGERRGGVFIAHGIALAAGVLAAFFFVK